ncbi:MAG: hypothetical protein RBR06_08135 [Desulfuromonadaceae bacterium]|nr:hypothetical protein [Desulfuromonadaceae bacterium]
MLNADWEAVCRRCGRCCYHKVLYRKIVYSTNIPCTFLNLDTMECSIYPNRNMINPQCAILTPKLVRSGALPPGCAYLQALECDACASHHITELPASLQRRLMRHLQ